MNVYENKHTGEIKIQESRPGEDWTMIQPLGAIELLTIWVLIFCFAGFIIFVF